MTEAETRIPWLPSREAVARIARHLGCTLEAAELQIVDAGKAGLIRARGVIEDQLVSPLPAAWHGATDLTAATMRPPGASCEITKVELCFGDLVAADLLTTTALGRAWWSAAEALAWIIIGVPLAWQEWAGLFELGGGMEQAGKELARIIGEDRVTARGRMGSFQGPMEQIPSSDLRIQGFTWVVRPDGDLGTSPPGRLAVFQGRRWYGIEVDSAMVRQAKPLQVERRMLDSMPEPVAPVELEPAPPTEPTRVEPVPSSAPKKRSRKKTPHGGVQTRRATAALNRIFPEEGKYRDRYPDEDEMTWSDVWLKFCEAYERYAKEYPSNYGCPSQSTVKRVMGRAE